MSTAIANKLAFVIIILSQLLSSCASVPMNGSAPLRRAETSIELSGGRLLGNKFSSKNPGDRPMGGIVAIATGVKYYDQDYKPGKPVTYAQHNKNKIAARKGKFIIL